MKLKLAVLPGDGIGPEIMEQGLAVTEAICKKFGHELSYKYAICGADAIDKVGDPFPEETFQTCMEADAVLFASVGDPKYDNNPNSKVRPEQGLLAMRKKLGLFANIRPVTTFDCLVHKSPLKDEVVKGADFICIRELTGGMYFGQKKEPAINENGVEDAFGMIQEPRFFDVMVTENTFGDILTDEGSCITGSMGLLPSASTGEHTPVFEPIHGSWPQGKGLNIANPLAQILSVAMLFEYFGLKAEGALVREAVDESLAQNVRTPEIQVEGGARYGTKEVGQWIVDYINKK